MIFRYYTTHLFWKKELDLEAQLPLRTKLWRCQVAVGLQLSVDR